MENIYESLNNSQLEAVTSTEGIIRVIAGAGSGKTRALSHRFAFLVSEIGILPGNILCVTFTNKAANEMRQRIHNLTGDNDTGYINTFHGFCVSILQEDIHAINYPKSFLVLDNTDIDAMLKIIYEERGLTLRDMTFSNARDMIEILKLKTRPDYYKDIITMSLEVLHEKYLAARTTEDIIFYGYLYQQKKCFGLDYNDLIVFSIYIFENNEAIKLKWQKRLEYIMIDEFQDIDEPQYKLMKILCDYHKNLFIVGDPDQTIYTWRGADVRYLLDFDKNFADVKTIFLNENYRSTPAVINAANSLISRNKQRIDKKLIPIREDKICDSKDCEGINESEGINKSEVLKPVAYFAPDTEKEAEWIYDQIVKLSGEGVSYRDITILYRAHYITRPIEEVFLKKELPYSIYSGIQFFARAEIKDALSYLRMVAYKDDLSFVRVINTPKRNMGDRRLSFIKEKAESEGISYYQALLRYREDPVFKNTKAEAFIRLIEKYSSQCENIPVSEILSDIIDESGYEAMLRTEGSQERLDNLAELKQSVYEYEVSCGEECDIVNYIDHIALFTNTDRTEGVDKVKLMTVHAAKGLEFPYVFIAGMNEGVFPSRKIRTLPAMEEERRLAFVALTRAMDGLYMSGADGRNHDGSMRYPSRFVLDIDKEYVDLYKPLKEGLIKEARDYIDVTESMMDREAMLDTMPVGTKVKHMVFGEGKIMDIDTEKKAYVIKFDNVITPRTISLKVKLEILEG